MGTIAAAILHAQHTHVVASLREAHALDERNAVARNSLRDVSESAVAQMSKHGIVVQLHGDRVYLSERGLDAYLNQQRKILRIVLAVSVAIILIATAAFAFHLFG